MLLSRSCYALSWQWSHDINCKSKLCKLFSVSWDSNGLTDGVQLDAAVSQVLRIEDDFVLGLSISDQDADFAGIWTQPDIGFEVVLKDVVQSHSCKMGTKTFMEIFWGQIQPVKVNKWFPINIIWPTQTSNHSQYIKVQYKNSTKIKKFFFLYINKIHFQPVFFS